MGLKTIIEDWQGGMKADIGIISLIIRIQLRRNFMI